MTTKPLTTGACLPGSDILIFSVEKGFIDHHREILLSIGFAPITLTTVETTLTVLRMMTIELVIVDGAAGFLETQRILKWARENGLNVPVLVVDQNSNQELRCEALELGAADYLDRPAFQDDVVRALLAHCARGGNPLWAPQLN